MPIVAGLDMLLTLVASAVLYRKMNEVNDLFNTSKEILTVGFFSIVALGEYQCALLSHGDVPKVLLCVDDSILPSSTLPSSGSLPERSKCKLGGSFFSVTLSQRGGAQ